MDGVGYLVILAAFFGLPVGLVFYGIWVAFKHGTKPPIAQDPAFTSTPDDEPTVGDEGGKGERPSTKRAA